MIGFVVAPFRSAWRHRQLVRALTGREVLASFHTSLLGGAWLVLQPLSTLLVYALVFGGLLGLGGHQGGMAFVTSLFAGMIVYQAFAETAAKAPHLVVARPTFVTKVVFPLDVLPWPVAAQAALNALISTTMLVLLHWLLVEAPAWTAMLLPVVLLPSLVLGLGAGYFLAALGVYVRDTADVVRVVLHLLFFLCPIVWTLGDVRDPTLSSLVLWNPLAVVIEAMRAALRGGSGPGLVPLAAVASFAVLFAAAGHRFFQRVRGGFADVL